jgi:hypothetical protein
MGEPDWDADCRALGSPIGAGRSSAPPRASSTADPPRLILGPRPCSALDSVTRSPNNVRGTL